MCKKYIFGYSIQGRQCAALKISDNVDIDEPEAEVMFDGGIHGDEIGGPENIIRFARDLCLQYGTNPTITNLINTREIWLYLMVNPDGRYNMSRYNANGVDLNRDWCYMWDAWGGSSGPCSQIESKNLRSCMYNNQFAVHTTYHSGTEFISYPWSYRPDSPLDVSHINQLAALYSTLSGYSYLPYGSGYNGMYAINGSTKDANYGIMGSISWSIEISNSKQPPTSQIMQYYNWNYPSMMALIEYSGYGLEGIVTDATTNAPITATVLVNNYFRLTIYNIK
ncbi:MAG: M14 family zinc carboxypeptidase [Anaerolineales bacterium]